MEVKSDGEEKRLRTRRQRKRRKRRCGIGEVGAVKKWRDEEDEEGGGRKRPTVWTNFGVVEKS